VKFRYDTVPLWAWLQVYQSGDLQAQVGPYPICVGEINWDVKHTCFITSTMNAAVGSACADEISD